MTTNYDPIAEQYKRAKQQPWRAHIEAFTLMRLIGDPTGKAVIDIACGEGFYTRMIRQRAAGFRDVRWHQPMLSPEGESAYGRDYWSALLDHPPLIFIECFQV